MANKNSAIYVDVEFTPKVEDFLDKVASEFESADFGQYISLEKDFKKQFDKVKSQLKELKEDIRSVLSGEISKSDNKAILNIANQLDTVAKEMEVLKSKTGSIDVSTSLGSSAKEAAKLSNEIKGVSNAVSDLQKGMKRNEIPIVDKREVELLDRFNKLLRENSSQDKMITGNLSTDLHELEKVSELVTELGTKFDDAFHPDEFSEPVNEDFRVITADLLEKIQILESLNDQIVDKYGQGALEKKSSLGYSYEDMLQEAFDKQDEVIERSKEYQAVLDDRYSNTLVFLRDIAAKQKEINIPLTIDKDKSKDNLYNQTIQLIQETSQRIEAEGLSIPIRVSILTDYTNDKIKNQLKDIKKQFAEGAGTEKLQERVDKILETINDRVKLELKFDQKKSEEEARGWIKDFKKTLGDDLKITPVIEIPEETVKSKTEELQKQLDSVVAGLNLDLGKANITLGVEGEKKLKDTLTETSKKAASKKKGKKTEEESVVDKEEFASALNLLNQLNKASESLDSKFVSTFKNLKIPEKTVENIKQIIALLELLDNTDIDGTELDLASQAILKFSAVVQAIDPNMGSKVEFIKSLSQGFDISVPPDALEKIRALGQYVTELKTTLGSIDKNLTDKLKGLKGIGEIPSFGTKLKTLQGNIETVNAIANSLDGRVINKLVNLQKISDLLNITIPTGTDTKFGLLGVGIKSLTESLKEVSKLTSSKAFTEISSPEFDAAVKKLSTVVNNLSSIFKKLESLSMSLSEDYGSDLDSFASYLQALKNAISIVDDDFINNITNLEKVMALDGFEVPDGFSNLSQTLTGLKQALSVLDKRTLNKIGNLSSLKGLIDFKVPKDFLSQIESLSTGLDKLKKVLGKLDESFFNELAKLSDKKMFKGIGAFSVLINSLNFKVPETFADQCKDLTSALKTLKKTLEGIDTDFLSKITKFSNMMTTFKKTFNVRTVKDIKKIVDSQRSGETDYSIGEFINLRNAYNKALKGDRLDLYNFENMFESFNRGEEDIPAEVLSYRDALVESIKAQDQLNSMMANPKYTEAYQTQLKGLEAELTQIGDIVDELFKNGETSISSSDLLARISKINERMKEVMNESSLPENKIANQQKINALILRAETINRKYSAARNTDAGRRLDEISKELSSGKVFNADEIKKYDAEVIKLEADIKKSGKDTKSVLDKLGTTISDNAIRFIANLVSFQRILQLFREGWQYALQFDTALTKISYTMNLTDNQLSAMGDDIMELSKNLKTSISDMSTIYQIYSNMNTSVKEMSTLAESTAVLSNLTGVDASTAADQIQGVVQQFEALDSVDASHIVDVFDYISANISVDYSKGIQGIAEAVQNVGNVADKAGISFEQLSAIIAKTMEQTRQDGSQIANGLKTILVRISKASTMSDEVDNETLSKASAALHAIGVEVYNVNGEYREFNTIMSELAEKWDDLTDAQQANISFQVAATRQTAVFKAILQNWEESSQLAEEAMDTEGNAIENQQKYLDSFAGKLQGVKNEIQDFWITFLNTDAVDTALDALQKLLELLNKFQDTFGGAGTIGLTLTSLLGFKEFTRIYGNGGKGTGIFQGIFDSITSGIKKATEARKAATIAIKQQTVAEQKESVVSAQNAAANESQAVSQKNVATSAMQAKNGTDLAAKSDAVETATSEANTAANEMQAASQSALAASGKALASTTVIGAIITVVTIAISKLWEYLKTQSTIIEDNFDKFKTTISEYNNELNDVLKTKSEISDLAQKYEKLSIGVDRFGKNISLNKDDFEEYTNTANRIGELFPTLISGYTDTHDAIVNLSDAYDTLNKKQEESLDNQYYEIIKNKDTINSWKYVYNKRPADFLKEGLNVSDRINVAKEIIEDLNSIDNVKDDAIFTRYFALYDKISQKYRDSGLDKYGVEGLDTNLLKWALPTGGYLSEKDYKEALEKYKNTQLPLLYKAIESINSEIEEQLSGVISLADAYLKVNSDYKTLEDENKAVLDEIIKNISKDTAKSWTKNSDVSEYVSSIIKEFKDSSPELKDALVNIISLDVSNLDPLSAYDVVSVYVEDIFNLLETEYAGNPEKIKEKKDLWSKILGLDTIEEDYERIKNLNSLIASSPKVTYEEVDEYYRNLSSENKKFWEDFFNNQATSTDWIDPINSFVEALNLEKSKQTWNEYVTANEDFKDAVEKYLKDEKTLGEFLNKIKTGSYTTDDVYTLQFEWGIDTTDASTMISDLTAKMDELEKEILSGNIQDVLNDKYASTEVKNHIAELVTQLKRANAEAQGLQNTLRQSSDVLPDVQNLKGAFDQLDSIYADVVDKENFDYSSIINNADFKSAFGDLDYYEEFSDIILNNTKDIKACQEAFNQLATEYIYGSKALESLNEQDAAVVTNMLKQLGVTNAVEVVESALADLRNYESKVTQDVVNANEALAVVKSEVSLESDKLDTYTWQEIAAFVEEADTANYTAQHLAVLALKKAELEGIDLTNDSEISYLLTLAKAAGVATESLTYLAEAKAQVTETENKLKTLPIGSRDWINAQTDLKNLNDRIAILGKQIHAQLVDFEPVKITPIELDYGGGEKTKTALDNLNKETGKAADETEEKVEEVETDYEGILDKAIEYLKKKLDAQTITLKQYLEDRLALIQDYYDRGLISAEKYYSSLSDYYSDQLEIYDSIISAINDVIDEEIKSLEEEKKTTEDSYNLKIQAIQDEIDALEKANEARQDAIDLQKAEYELARSQNQRTRLIYKNGQMVYANDPTAVREAREAKANKEYELSIKSLNEKIKALEEELSNLTEDIDNQISALNEYKDEWNSISDAYEKAQNAALAYQYFGEDWKDQILGQNTDILNSYKDMYAGIEQAMRDAAESSALEAWKNAMAEAEEAAKNALSAANSTGSTSSGGAGGKGGGDTTEETKEETTETLIKTINKATKEIKKANDNGSDKINVLNNPSVYFDRNSKVTARLNYRGTAYGDGSWTAKSHGTDGPSLVGELGPELRVSNGKYDILGKDGAEFANIKPDDIIFNHKQTEALLKNGKIKGRGKAFADGTLIPISDLPVGSVNIYKPLNIIADSIPKIRDSLRNIIKQDIPIGKGTSETPVITVNNPTFTCNGVTGEEVLHQIESSFSGLFINAYQQAMK